MGKCLTIMYPESVKENKNLPKLGFTSIRCKPTPELIDDFRGLDGISLDKAKELFAEGEEGQEIVIYNNKPAIKFSKEDDTKILIADNTVTFYPNKLLNIILEDFSGLVNLKQLGGGYSDKASYVGDISGIKTLTSLTSLNLGSTSVTGDISGIKTLTSLTSLNLGSTSVTGDISGIKTLTSLTSLTLRGTSVTGDISGLSNLLTVGLNGTSMRWGSSSTRSSKTNIPLGMSNSVMSKDYCNFGRDLDNFLIDEAACTNFSGNALSKKIFAKGTRTSASDAAIKTLQDNGWTVSLQSE